MSLNVLTKSLLLNQWLYQYNKDNKTELSFEMTEKENIPHQHQIPSSQIIIIQHQAAL